MNKQNATWNDLANHISKMTTEERLLPVLVWGEEKPLCRDVSICIDNEDMCYDHDCPEDGCFPRSEYCGDIEDDLVMALEAGKTYLLININN